MASSTSSTACGAVGFDLAASRARSFPARSSAPARFCKTAGGIDQHHFGAVGFRRGDRLKRKAGRIGALGACAITGSPGARAPDFQAARWPRRGRCRRQPASPCLPSARNLAASLPMVVVLPEPLTPDTRMTNGVRGDFERLRHRRQHLLDFAGEQRPHFFGRDALLVAGFAQHRGNTAGESRGRDRRGSIRFPGPPAYRHRACAW